MLVSSVLVTAERIGAAPRARSCGMPARCGGEWGALLGGFIGRALGFYGESEGAGMLMAILGAILLLAIYRMVVGRRTVRHV